MECEYEIKQDVNPDGSPKGGVSAGRIIVTIVSPEKSLFLYRWMLSDCSKYDGSIAMDVTYNRLSKNACRYVYFKDAYCVGLYEYFNNQNSDMATMRLTLYATSIDFMDSPNGISAGYNNVTKKSVI